MRKAIVFLLLLCLLLSACAAAVPVHADQSVQIRTVTRQKDEQAFSWRDFVAGLIAGAVCGAVLTTCVFLAALTGKILQKEKQHEQI